MFRGAKGNSESISNYQNVIMQKVRLPGCSSCSQDLSIGLDYAFKNSTNNLYDKSILFVISCQNYDSFPGIRLNHKNYTLYPHEEEILLCEGCEVWVLDVEVDIKIENEHESFSNFNGKTVTIIHLLL